MSFDEERRVNLSFIESFNPFGTGQCLSTEKGKGKKEDQMFQSLWNRAMSFDTIFNH